jgi:pilus assembly protein Flp/PilA
MTYLVTWLMSLLHRDEEGQGLAEYALILALIAIIAIAALILLGGSISAILQTIGDCLADPVACSA